MHPPAKDTGHQQKLRRGRKGPPGAFRGSRACQQLDSGLWPPALGEHKNLLFEASWLVGLGYAALAANTPDFTW